MNNKDFLVLSLIVISFSALGFWMGYFSAIEPVTKARHLSCQISCMDKYETEYSALSFEFTNSSKTLSYIKDSPCWQTNIFGNGANMNISCSGYHGRDVEDYSKCFCGFSEEQNNTIKARDLFWKRLNGGGFN